MIKQKARRLVHLIRAYSIFDVEAKAIEVFVNRFDDETKLFLHGIV